MTVRAVPDRLRELTDARVVDTLTDREIEEWTPALFPRWTHYMTHTPTEKQWAFLLLDGEEALFGGQAGGGKSDCLLMAALQYADVPGYSALLLRRTYADLDKPGSLIPRSHEWLRGTDAHWRGDKHQWVFPSGAILDFGYLDHDADMYNYQSSQYQMIGFDELTQFQENWYRYMFSRIRRPTSMAYVPPRMRAATNPGGVGHEWVKRRFILEGSAHGRAFVPSALEDNPHVDQEEYDRALQELDPLTRAQLRNGDWDVQPAGDMFNPAWIHIIDEDMLPTLPRLRWIRSWDMAATKSSTAAYTAGVELALHKGADKPTVYIRNVARQRGDPGETEALIRHTAELDGRETSIWIEQEGGSGGINTMWRYQKTVLFGFHVEAFHPRMDKVSRARPMSSMARNGQICLVRRRNGNNGWMTAYLDELATFPQHYKDQVDSTSQGITVLTTQQEPRIRRL